MAVKDDYILLSVNYFIVIRTNQLILQEVSVIAITWFFLPSGSLLRLSLFGWLFGLGEILSRNLPLPLLNCILFCQGPKKIDQSLFTRVAQITCHVSAGFYRRKSCTSTFSSLRYSSSHRPTARNILCSTAKNTWSEKEEETPLLKRKMKSWS